MLSVYVTGIALLALVIGVPLGVVLGGFGWNKIADYLQVVPEPTVPFAVVGFVVVAVLLLALATVVPTGRRASRRTPAEVLRTESA